MSRVKFTAIAVLLFLSGPVFNGAGTVYAQNERMNESKSDLLRRIESLENKVKEQNSKIESLRKIIDKMKNERYSFAFPPDSLYSRDGWDLPHGARPFIFNGRKYYTMPLGGPAVNGRDSVERK